MRRENGCDIKPPTHHERREQAKLAWPLVWPRRLGTPTRGVALGQHPGIVRNQPKHQRRKVPATGALSVPLLRRKWADVLWG
jgi:hypothetical protein